MQKYTRSTFISLFALGTILTLQTACPASNNNNTAVEKEQIRIGTMYTETAGDPPAVSAIKLAVADLNQSGALPREVVLVPRYYNENIDRTELAQDLFDTVGVAGLVTEFSSTALKVLRLTNTDPYANIVQCSGNSTNTKINNPNTPASEEGLGADQNDTLFRAVSNDIKQAQLVWTIIEDKEHAGFLYVDDAYGATFEEQINAKAQADIGGVTYSQFYPEELNASDLQPIVDDILARNAAGELNTIVIAGLPTQGGAILKALVEAPTPFAGQIIGTDGLIDPSIFLSQTGAFTEWLNRSGNVMRGTTPENFFGDNSDAWIERFKSSSGVSSFDAFVTSHADCMYSFALALIEADVKGEDPAGFLKQGMINQKQENLSGDIVVEVTPNAEGLKAARSAFLEGKKVRLNGASGRIEFDDDGDRALQFYAVMKVVGAGPYEWARDQVWDPVSGICVDNCD